MNRHTILITAVIASFGVLAYPYSSNAQSAPTLVRDGAPTSAQTMRSASLRGNLLYRGNPQPQVGSAQSTRSVALAFGLSAIVPGGGQVYNRDWVKAGVGIALEAALWTGYVIWKQEGESLREDYWAYAHEHYSPVRYAEWLNDYPGYAGDPIPTESVSSNVDFTRPDSWSQQERQQVRQLINEIQRAERNSSFAEPPHAAFSHQLPHFGEQQYYELIGKYHQYAAGWEDCGADCDVENPSDRFFEYAELHGEANSLLRRASRVTALVVINHGLAALDAAITAQLYNNSLETELSLRHGMDGTARPYVTMEISF